MISKIKWLLGGKKKQTLTPIKEFDKTSTGGRTGKSNFSSKTIVSDHKSLQKAFDLSTAAIVNTSDDLPLFSRTLYDTLKMQPSVRKLVCPIEVLPPNGSSKGKFALIVRKSANTLQIAQKVEQNLEFHGFVRADNLLYLAHENVMIDLARGHITSVVKGSQPQLGHFSGRDEESALADTFINAVNFAVLHDASDMHIEVFDKNERSQIRFRIDGIMTDPKEFLLSTALLADVLAYAFNVLSKSGSETTYNPNIGQQCRIMLNVQGKKTMLRWASTSHALGTKTVLRVLYQDESIPIRTLEELGYFPMQVDIWNRVAKELGGGIVLSGVVGSGKSTSMQSVMGTLLSKSMSKYSVEDPVEYIIPGVIQISISRGLSDTDNAFLETMRQIKRLDPDVVLIGEIRDRHSGSLFRDVADSGHRALATIHSPSAIDTITMRLTSEEIGIPKDVIATPGFINLLVYQALVPKLCSCSVPAESVYDTKYLNLIHRLFDIDVRKIRGRNKDGCERCRRLSLPELNGVKGRIVVAEMVELDGPMRDFFLEGRNALLKDYISSKNEARFDEPISTGKSAQQVAMYHVSQGTMDPVDVEEKFGTFLQYEAKRKG